MLPYLAKGFADVVKVKDPELRLSWILGSWKSLQRTFSGCREPEKWQRDGGVRLCWLWKWRTGAASRRCKGQGNNTPLEPPEGTQAVWSLILAQGVLGPRSVPRTIRNKTQKHQRDTRQEDTSFRRSYWRAQRVPHPLRVRTWHLKAGWGWMQVHLGKQH